MADVSESGNKLEKARQALGIESGTRDAVGGEAMLNVEVGSRTSRKGAVRTE